MFLMETVDDLWNHIAYVLGCAPDQSPVEDFLPDDQQMNLDLAFEQLRQDVQIAYTEESFLEKRVFLNDILDQSYDNYKKGENIKTGHFLNDLQNNIFK